jgi:hypothetical protein
VVYKEKMLKRIKLKNVLLILLGISMLTVVSSILFYIFSVILFVLNMASKIVGALLVGYNSYHIFKQIKNDEENEVLDED